VECLAAEELMRLANVGEIGQQQRPGLLHVAGCSACRQRLHTMIEERRAETPANPSTPDAARTALFPAGLDSAPRPISEGGASANGAPDAPQAGGKLGRYLLLGPLGEGGMGIVFRAYDPSLDRAVAIKLLRIAERSAEETASLRARLMGEAQAMARLSHPNVVRVHDLGQEAGHVYIAMELIEGSTLRDWQRAQRGWREIAAVYREAGAGLAAAHAAGLVHRDFKPDNVLVSKDGRAHVSDFGLARLNLESALAGLAPPQQGAGPGSPMTSPGAPDTPLALVTTRIGVAIGTPLYIAPEQLEGKETGAAADQFAFCVSLWEALAGEAPFATGDARERLGRIQRGDPGAVAAARMPRWLARTLRKGMNAEPSARYGSMHGLLRDLDRDPWRRVVAPALVAAALVAVALLGMRALALRGQQTCRGAEAKLAGIWDAPSRAAIQKAIAATNLPYSDAAWSTVSKSFDRYAADWTAMRTEACEATAVRHEQRGDLLELRMTCLDDRLRHLAAASRLLAAADASAVSHANAIAASVEPLAGCADEAALRQPTAPTAAQKPQVEALREREAAMVAMRSAGHLNPAIAEAQRLLIEARKLGYDPLSASLLFELAAWQNNAGEFDIAKGLLNEAAAAGLAVHNDRIVALSWINLTLLNTYASRMEDAALDVQQAQAAVSRVKDSYVQFRLANALAIFARFQGHDAEALQQAARAVELAHNDPGDVLSLIDALRELGTAQMSAGHYAESLATHERAYALAVVQYGAEHQYAADEERSLAASEVETRRTAAARAHLRHAVAVVEREYGPRSTYVVEAYEYLGLAMFYSDPAQALVAFEHAAEIAALRTANVDSAQVGYDTGRAEQLLKRLEEGRQKLAQALALSVSLDPSPANPQSIQIANGLADVLLDQGKTKEAHQLLEPARVAVETSHEKAPQWTDDATTLFELGRLAQAEHRVADARRELERSVSLARDSGADTTTSIMNELVLAEVELADAPAAALTRMTRIAALPPPEPGVDDLVDRDGANFLLARALVANQTELPRAAQLAASARDGYARRGERFAPEHKAVEQWLSRPRRN
jgi:tetratricopeptide (TPR) repeat protein